MKERCHVKCVYLKMLLLYYRAYGTVASTLLVQSSKAGSFYSSKMKKSPLRGPLVKVHWHIMLFIYSHIGQGFSTKLLKGPQLLKASSSGVRHGMSKSVGVFHILVTNSKGLNNLYFIMIFCNYVKMSCLFNEKKTPHTLPVSNMWLKLQCVCRAWLHEIRWGKPHRVL